MRPQPGSRKRDHASLLGGARDYGILAYRSGRAIATELVWFDRTGKPAGTVTIPDRRFTFSLSRDDQRLAVARASNQRGDFDLRLHDLPRHTDLRFTFDSARESSAVWSLDGRQIIFASEREGHFDLYQKPTSGSAEEKLLLGTAEVKTPTDWSLDGRHLAYTARRRSPWWSIGRRRCRGEAHDGIASCTIYTPDRGPGPAYWPLGAARRLL